MSNELRASAPTPEIQAELQALEQSLARLGELNVALAAKLEPVLTDPVAQPIAAGYAEDTQTALGRYVRRLNGCVEIEIARIQSITDRVGF